MIIIIKIIIMQVLHEAMYEICNFIDFGVGGFSESAAVILGPSIWSMWSLYAGDRGRLTVL